MNAATLEPISCGISRASALRLIAATGPDLQDLLQAAAELREWRTAAIVTYSRKVVKQGTGLAQACLNAGADDLGGTLMNESISTAAGAPHGQFLRPADLRGLIFEAGRVPAERSTTYRVRRLFESEPEQPDMLDLVEPAGAPFGSYTSLISSEEFRFRKASLA